jgi:Cu/Ag efflux pump CusA
VAWLDVIRSESVPGLSSILIYFEPGTDLYRARQMVAERLAQAAVAIPHVSKPPMMIQPTSSSSRFMIVGLSSEKLSLIEMSVLARWTISPRLMGVPGVANVAIWGNRDRQLQVLVDPERLQAQGVSLEQVVETTGNALWVSSLSFLEASSPGTGGFIDTPNQRLGIWHVLPISSPEDLAKVPVDGASLTLGDVSQIVEDHQPLIGDAIVNDNPNLLLVIEKLPGINTLEVTKGVESAIAALRPGFSDIEFDTTLFRPATFIEVAIANITRTMVLGALLAILVFSLLFHGWRTALISLIAIPTSLVAAMFVLHLQGATLNAMVLSGFVIALGIIIDDAVVDVDNIALRLAQNRMEANPKPVESIILEASSQMRSTLFFATLVTLLAVIPIFFMNGISGVVFQPTAISYVLAVLASMVVAMTVTPALSMLVLSDKQQSEIHQSKLSSSLQRSYGQMLARTIQKPRLIYAVMVVLVAAGLFVLPSRKQDQMLSAFQESYITIGLTGAPSTSQSEMDRIVSRMSSELRSLPGIDTVGAHVGRAVLGDQIVGVNSAELWVGLNPDANYDVTVAAIQETVEGYPGLAHDVRTYLQGMLSQPQHQTNARDAFTVRVYGEDHKVLGIEAEKLNQTLAGINGVVDSHVIHPVEEPTMEIEVDLALAQKYGIKPGEVRRAAATLLSGLQVGSLFEEQKVFDVVVWSSPEKRQSLTDIRELLIDTPSGGHVRLGDIADVRITSAPTVIQREAISPYIDIAFNVQGRNAGAVLADVETAMRNFAFPLEYHAEVQEDYAAQQAAQQRFIIIMAVTAIGIFLLFQASFASWKLALATLFTLPVALTGGVLAGYLSSGALSITSLFGLLAVLGITARNSILLFRHYQSLEDAGEAFGPMLIVQGSREKLAPVLMTALTTGLSLLPFVLFGNIPGHELALPIVIVILGGLVTSTLLNLFVLPPLYLRFGEASREPELGLLPVVAGDD